MHILAAILYSYHDDTGTKLGGALDIAGNLNVMGLLSVSVHFHMEFQYESQGNLVWGEASLTVEISVAFFSKSVTLGPIRKEFGGSGTSSSGGGASTAAHALSSLPRKQDEPKTVDEMISSQGWDAYLAAFDAA